MRGDGGNMAAGDGVHVIGVLDGGVCSIRPHTCKVVKLWRQTPSEAATFYLYLI